VVAVREAFQQKAVGKLAGEPDPDANTGLAAAASRSGTE